MNSTSANVTTTLASIRDYIRWGASQFTAHQVFLGHGTATALDEAVAIVLHTIHQPYNLAETYFDAILSEQEREEVVDLINKRINERKPSAYITHEAVFAGLPFYVDERVLVPRSPIAELIEERFEPWVNETQVYNVLDLCTGSACIAIACAYAFPEAHIDAVEFSTDACEVARINIEKHQLEEQVTLYQSDLFKTLPEKPYDIIVSNPPYVSIDEWNGLPAEFHAEPEIGFKGGQTGLDLVLRILVEAEAYLAEQGILIVEVGSSSETLQQTFPEVPFYWLEFERGGDGVFLLTTGQIRQYHSLFLSAL